MSHNDPEKTTMTHNDPEKATMTQKLGTITQKKPQWPRNLAQWPTMTQKKLQWPRNLAQWPTMTQKLGTMSHNDPEKYHNDPQLPRTNHNEPQWPRESQNEKQWPRWVPKWPIKNTTSFNELENTIKIYKEPKRWDNDPEKYLNESVKANMVKL